MTRTFEGCIFCQIAQGDGPFVAEWDDAVALVPLDPVTPGHVIVIPRTHEMDALGDPDVTAATMRRAAEIAPWPCNIITSAGEVATQSVLHLHIHVVPRRTDDGLPLPWTPQHEARDRKVRS